MIPCNEEILLTPVEKPATSSRIKKDAWKGGDDESAFDDSFVKFSSREESQLFDPTQLNSILNRSSSGKITSKKSFDAVGAESSHFDSLVKNLSDWPISMEHQDDDSHDEQKDLQITARDFSDGSLKNVKAFNFELISEGFWEILENIPSPEEEFKVPNIGDYDIKKQTTTPKQANKKSSAVAPDSPIFYSQSPLLVQKRSRRAIFSSTGKDLGRGILPDRNLSRDSPFATFVLVLRTSFSEPPIAPRFTVCTFVLMRTQFTEIE